MMMHHATTRRRGFSLIEVLLAIFILGIGAISIAAIFPAGIAQQRLTVDEMVGPTVANNALEIIRSKVRQQDFGTYEDTFSSSPPIVTIPGDWPWSRPAFFTTDSTVSGNFVPQGSIAIFDGTLPNTTSTEVPYNVFLYGSSAPDMIITQGERYYPQASQFATVDVAPKPEYVWDCMFRKFGGRVYVAIFVYRVSIPNVGAFTYKVPTVGGIPPVPIWITFNTATEQWDSFGPDLMAGTVDDAQVPGTIAGSAYDPTDNAQQWQFPGQWILDQNNNVHRVIYGRENQAEGPVELQRPVPVMAGLPVFSTGNNASEDIVTDIWYMPRTLNATIGGAATEISVTPVYVMVKEL